MSEERLQEIKDSISLQYKVQEANDLNNFNIFTDEEQELVEEIERLKEEKESWKRVATKNFNEAEDYKSIIKEARDLFYEKCRISQNGAYIFNEVDYEELSNILGSEKE